MVQNLALSALYGLERVTAAGTSCCTLLTAMLLLHPCWYDNRMKVGFRIHSQTPSFVRAIMSNICESSVEINKCELWLGFSHLWFDKERRKTDAFQPQQICSFVLLFTISS